MNRVVFMTLMWYRSWYLLREVTWESVCDTFRKASFCMKKVMLPASSYDAVSIVHTKSGYHKGIGMSYFLEDSFCMKKVMPRASGGDARGVRSCAQTKRCRSGGIGQSLHT
jgi:hypothetical protein